MKVLFVCSGNSENFNIIPFIKAQGDSLEALGVQVEYYPVIGKGLIGYLKAGLKLRQYLKTRSFDLIHAHFSLSGWAAVIGAGNTPVVLSLMGDDAQGNYIGVNKIEFKSRLFMLSTKLIQPFVDVIISKSVNLEKHVYLKRKSIVIPNGINTRIFTPRMDVRKQDVGFSPDKQQVLFLGNRSRIGKNFSLAQQAVGRLNSSQVELVNPFPLRHGDIPRYLNAADVLVLPSFMEGSPNVVKEAMACNCPIVATDVGDVKWLLGDTEGCYITSFDPTDFAEKIKAALSFSREKGRTNGAKRIEELGLDSATVAQRVLEVYQKVISNDKGSMVYRTDLREEVAK